MLKQQRLRCLLYSDTFVKCNYDLKDSSKLSEEGKIKKNIFSFIEAFFIILSSRLHSNSNCIVATLRTAWGPKFFVFFFNSA